MSISFNNIPAGLRVPLFYAEMDNSMANSGNSSLRTLLIAQVNDTATHADIGKLVLVSRTEQAAEIGGAGSPLHAMHKAYRRNDTFGEVWVLPIQLTTGEAAAGSFTFTGPATAGGVLNLYIAGQRVQVPVVAGDSAAAIANAALAAVNAIPTLPVTAAPDGTGTIKLVAKFKGLGGDDITLMVNRQGAAGGETLPAGVSVLKTPMSGGSGAPDLADALAAVGDESFEYVAHAFTDTTSLGAMAEWMNDTAGRWAWNKQIYGHVYSAMRGSLGVQVPVVAGDGAGTIATAALAAVNAVPTLPVTAVPDETGTIRLVAKFKGLGGDDITLMVNRQGAAGGETLPAGVSVLKTPMSGGSGAPDMADALAAVGDEPFEYVAHAFTDTTSMNAMAEWMNDTAGRWAWNKQIYGHVYSAMRGSLGVQVEIGQGRNDQHATVHGFEPQVPQPAWEVAAAWAARTAVFIGADPARPTQTGVLTGIDAAPPGQRFTLDERQSLLSSGIATAKYEGGYRIERSVTTYQRNAYGAEDDSYLDSETLHTSAYVLRYLFAIITSKYGRHKLANDGTRFGPGQAIVTPSVIRGELVGAYRELEYRGIVENAELFKQHLIVERNSSNPNRLDVLFPPDYVNQLRIFALLNQFRLQYSNLAE